MSARLELADGRVEVLDLPGAADRPAFVLLHEGLGSVELWRDFPHHLSRVSGRRVIAFSRYGHGRSVPPRTARTPAFFHEEALQVLPGVLEAMRAPKPILLGHSDGASIALIYAARNAVAGLVLIAPHVVVEEITVEAIRRTREEFATGRLRERMARYHDDPEAAFHGWCDVWLDPAFRSWSLEEEASRLTAPTLLIQGADDPYGTLDQLDRIEAQARGPVRRAVVPGGHSPHLEHRDDVVAAVVEFSGSRGP